MSASLRRIAFAVAAALAMAPAAPLAQELAGPADGLVIAWRAPAAPTMPTVTWTIAGRDGQVSAVRSEARALFERMKTESTMYRVIFPLTSTDPFGSVYEFQYDTAALDAIGGLEDGKTVRIAARTVSTITHPQTKQVIRNEYAGASVLTVEKRETIAVPAGQFETIVLRLEGEAAPGTPPGHRVYRRYWYAPALGWYVRHEVVMTGPTINQRNEYVAAKITPAEKRAERK
jgi:hypothetical protein